jgi:lipopolysaccharide/colanic/teichoic acid biosynthesis glycosyltransferase
MEQGLFVKEEAGKKSLSMSVASVYDSETGQCLSDELNGSIDHLFNPLSDFDAASAETPGIHEFLIRTLDITGSALILFLSLPLFAIITVIIKVFSPGPVIYRQLRVGKEGKLFVLYKFRTMVKHAEQIWGFTPATQDDERVTPIGKFLRRTRLDELPQLVNVLKGEMSLVGPRPENIYRVNMYAPLRGVRLLVKPGITGLAQIRSFYDLKPEHKVRYDCLYIQKRSLLLNLYILLQTIHVIFLKRGW